MVSAEPVRGLAVLTIEACRFNSFPRYLLENQESQRLHLSSRLSACTTSIDQSGEIFDQSGEIFESLTRSQI